jgi:hypothetical protein
MNKKKENNPFRRFAVILTPWNDFIIDDVGPIEEPSLDYLQNKVGGFIESVRIYAKPRSATPENNGFCAWVNEEGMLQGLPENELASVLYNLPGRPIVDDEICGNMVVLGHKLGEDGGITPPLTLSEVVDLRDTLMEKTGADLHVLWASEGKLYKI